MKNKKLGARFERVYWENGLVDGVGVINQFIMKDKKTGVLYLHTENRSGTSVIVLVDRDGKPLVDE
ncbi:MAG: DUF6440 family protein [Turicibacter sp.]|nr:DUF6440 family protein [Turicibacter sp.]